MTGVSPININIGKFHCRVTCSCSCCKTTTPIMLGQVGVMGAVIWPQLQSHTGCAKLLSPYESVAQPVASSSRSPHNSVSDALDGSEDGILHEQSEDSDTSDSEELSFINVDSSEERGSWGSLMIRGVSIFKA